MTQMPSPKLPTRTTRLLSDPALRMVLLLFVAAAAALWSSKVAAERSSTEHRVDENARRIVQATRELKRLMPPTLDGDAAVRINSLIDAALSTAGISDASLRSRSVRTLGPLGDTGVLKFQEHVELAGVSQVQAASLLAAVEESALPMSLSAADLSEGTGDGWNLVFDLSWLEHTGNPR